jgi:branched-chain amino acid transport system permease protein
MLLAQVLRDVVIWVLLAISVNFVVGKTSIWSVGQLAFFGIGACVSAAMLKGGFGFAVAVLAATAVACLASALIGAATFRISQDFFVILSVAFSELVLGISISWKGPAGFDSVPRPGLGFLGLQNDWRLLCLLFLPILVIVMLLWRRFTRLPIERVCALVRYNEDMARVLRISPLYYKLGCFACGAGVAALAGCLATISSRSTDPNQILLTKNIMLFAAVLVGGVNSLAGSVLAGILLVAIPRILERLFFGGEFGALYGANVTQLVFGAILLLCIRYLPAGLAGESHLPQEGRRR